MVRQAAYPHPLKSSSPIGWGGFLWGPLPLAKPDKGIVSATLHPKSQECQAILLHCVCTTCTTSPQRSKHQLISQPSNAVTPTREETHQSYASRGYVQ